MAIAGRFAVLAATAFSASGFQRPPPQLARSYLPGAPSPSAWSPSVPRKNPFPLRCCKGAPRDEPTGHRTKRSLSQKSFSPVEETALYTAFWRQCETTRKDISAPLICDTFAEALVAQFLPSETQERLRRDAGFIAARDLLACRTKFIDDVVVNWHAKAAQGSSATQVVILGAGMDTRPYRLLCSRDVQSVKFFEVDRDQSLLTWKRSTLRQLTSADDANSPPDVVCSGCDLSRAGEVLQATSTGEQVPSASLLSALLNRCEEFESQFEEGLPTLFICEGLLEYLHPSIHRQLFRILRAAASGGGDKGTGEDAEEPRHMIVLQNLEPSFGETFNRDKQLPYETLTSSADQKRALREAGFSGVRIFDGAYFGEAYGRETNVGFNMITAVC